MPYKLQDPLFTMTVFSVYGRLQWTRRRDAERARNRLLKNGATKRIEIVRVESPLKKGYVYHAPP